METPNLHLFAARIKAAQTEAEKQQITQQSNEAVQNYLNFDNGKSKATKVEEILSQIEQGVDDLYDFVKNPTTEKSSYLKAA